MSSSPRDVEDMIFSVGGERIDPPTLVPAKLILDLSGEAVRQRLCTFSDGEGGECSLRPDMTVPIAALVAQGSRALARYVYSGTVWRLPRPGSGEAPEFSQVGFEWFAGGGPEEDAEAFCLAMSAAYAGGERSSSVRIGDVAVFASLLESLSLSQAWRARLLRSFARGGAREALAPQAPPSALATALAGLTAEQAKHAVEEIFAIAGTASTGQRSAADIAGRLRERAADPGPSAQAAAAIGEYLSIECPADEASEALAGFARSHGVTLGQALSDFTRRQEAISRRGPPFWPTARFSARDGWRFEYYDGFVFELAAPETPDRPSVAGGRYDGLVGRLSGQAVVSQAIGAAVRLDRLEAGALS
ncbi:MAG: ATP phosphoribosyltransferase regulatory subunit [Alphaproteobacteria bacterium]|nr:ATP phosphoribosyltransferase regulatory subunit [Alphaproteobacteria bacterium]